MNKESTVVQLHQNPLLSAALAYVSIGWHILPCWWIEKNEEGKNHCACGNESCASPGKHPLQKLVPWGQTSATTDPELVKSWWERFPKANIAVFLAPSGLCAIDIDPRNGGIDTIDDVEAKHGALVSDLLQFSGGGGEHRIFLKPGDNQTLPGKLGAGVDVKLNGYIMLEPSNHVSGGSYMFEASSDPRDGIMASPLPDWLRDLSGHKVVSSTATGRVIPVSEEQRAEIIEAMCAIPADDRDTWLQVGMALQSTGDAQWAFSTWDSWSAQSNKYNQVDQIRVWRSFKSKGLDGITYKTIFGMAKALGTVVPIAAASEPAVPVESVTAVYESISPVANHLLTLPGALGAAVDWVNSTAPKPQPIFAVQSVLAFASTVLGRRFVTSNDNFTSLYFLNVGESGSGKEYAKTAIERLLNACNLGHLIGPSGYTSESGVISCLLSQPNHVAVIDEFHRVLEQASIKNNANARSAITLLMTAWGTRDSVLRSKSYSTFGMSERDAKAAKDRVVYQPSNTMMAMAIPDLWETVGSAAVRDGFLNRFLIAETEIGRQVSNFQPKVAVPQEVIDWATSIRARYTGIIDPDINPIGINPVVVGIEPSAGKLFSNFEEDCMTGELCAIAKEAGAVQMVNRSTETAMRVAFILALGRDANQVSAKDAQWAIDYVRCHALRSIFRLKNCLADSEFEAQKKTVVAKLKGSGKPLTIAQIVNGTRRLDGLKKRELTELMDTLVHLGAVAKVDVPRKAGPRTDFYVAVDNSDSDDLES